MVRVFVLRILVADDNPSGRQLVKDILESIGYDAITAIDGLNALTLIQTQVPDLIILDVNMPGMSGFEVCEVVKNDPALSHIPVLMLTAQTDIDSRITGLGLGADDYLGKPFNPRELAARVEARLRNKSETDTLRKMQELVRQTFERFVAPSVVERLLENPERIKLGGQLQEVTVMFSDLEGFTSVSEYTEPENLLAILNSYHELVVSIVQEHDGTIDKFIGDAVMALYNTPLTQPDHALRAVRTALAIRYHLPAFWEQFDPHYRMKINFGIHSGLAVVGNVGTPQIMNFSAVGDTINLASRLQGMGEDGQILLSQATYELLADEVQVRPIGLQNVKGRSEPVMIYEALQMAFE
jgi:adenylate cyclase